MSIRLMALGCLFATGVSGADLDISFKNRRALTAAARTQTIEGIVVDEHHALQPKRRPWNRSHIVIQFREMPGIEQTRELRLRGARVLSYIPNNALLVSVENGAQLKGLDLHWSGQLHPAGKLSPLLDNGKAHTESTDVVVEFHPDVDSEEAREQVREHGLEVVDNPRLRSNDVLAKGPLERMRLLAEWDEVSYIYPASKELVEGLPVKGCLSAATIFGPIGQYIARASEGWDGPGLGAAELGYFFSTFPRSLGLMETEGEISRALAEWARYAEIGFTPAVTSGAARTLEFLFASGHHGDPFPFDGHGSVLAHAFYPAPPNPEPIAGDIHFDDDENWAVGENVDLYTVALHEIGHALGLGHSDQPGSVMYPYYLMAGPLTVEDIRGIRSLYAARQEPPVDPEETPPTPDPDKPLTLNVSAPPETTAAPSITISGTVEGGVGGVMLAWWTDRGEAGAVQGSRSWTIPALPLAPGLNRITITAHDAEHTATSWTGLVTRIGGEPPSLAINSPTSASTYNSATSSIVLAGTASRGSRVTWANTRGGSGEASGSSQWQTPPIALLPGTNIITVTAAGDSGLTTSCIISVTYTSHASGSDTAAPSITIVSPAFPTVLTYSPTITLRGTATDNAGVVEVTWSTSAGNAGVAQGTSNWNTGEIPVYEGATTITVRAKDGAGNTSWRSVSVTRRRK